MTIINKTVDDEIFLQGDYLALAINGSGTLGSENRAPSGFYSDKDIGYYRLGLWADFDKFGSGKAPTIHEVMLKGLPVEGFSVGYTEGGERYVRTNHERSGRQDIEGTSSNKSTDATAKAGWTGTTSENVKVNQTVSLTEDGKYVRVDVTLTNASSSAVGNVRYMRTIDPDQGSGFDTTNKLVEQGGADGALVSATASGASFFYYAKDARAVVSTYGLENVDPYASAAYSSAEDEGYTLKGDHAVNITFGLGTLAAHASTSFTFYMGVTDDLDATVAAIDSAGGAPAPDPEPTNTAPTAVDDAFSLVAGGSVKGDVLANDRDRDGDDLSASLKSGPEHGTVSLKADGSFTYKADAGYVGSDSFRYAASDGQASDTATVKLTVSEAPTPTPSPAPPLPDDPILTRAGTQDLSGGANQTVTGPDYHNSFFVNSAASSGDDRVTNFGHDDVLVTTRALSDPDSDGLIGFARNTLNIDGVSDGDTVKLSGVSGVRSLGRTEGGLYVYADDDVRPADAIESKLGDNTLKGDASDRVAHTFFFDTALDLNLGDDTISAFGNKDILVTTSALSDRNGDHIIGFGSDGMLDLVGGSGAPGDTATPGAAGHVVITDTGGDAVNSLELDGKVTHDGTTYYVYSLVGSSADTDSLHF